MFLDLNFTKLLLLGVVALLVFGPDGCLASRLRPAAHCASCGGWPRAPSRSCRRTWVPSSATSTSHDLNPKHFVRKHLGRRAHRRWRAARQDGGQRQRPRTASGHQRRGERTACPDGRAGAGREPALRRRGHLTPGPGRLRPASGRAAGRRGCASGQPDSPRSCVAAARPGQSGSDSTSGMPASPASRSLVSIGTSPSSGTGAPVSLVSVSATAAPPPEPKTSIRSSQCGHGR